MNHRLRHALVYLLIGAALLFQQEPNGDLLVNSYRTVAIICILCLCMVIWNIARGLGEIDDELDEEDTFIRKHDPIMPEIRRIISPEKTNRELSQSSALNKLSNQFEWPAETD